MTKMLGFDQIHYESVKNLQQFIFRGRLITKELMEDFKCQDDMLDKEFHKEKTYIEGMIMRGEDLYNYKYRNNIEFPEVTKNKWGGKMVVTHKQSATGIHQKMHQFLEQQSLQYAKKLKKIQIE
mmetsp:Transcript_19764/g.18815  ORF Transcript_19764/g.18815 Transcript_19764/m.18815 type:complete len:124 (+) Transcript_19764:776-1147(+)